MGMPLLPAGAALGMGMDAGALPGVEVAEPGCRRRSEALRCGGGACPGLASGGLPVGDCTPLGTPVGGISTLNPACHCACLGQHAALLHHLVHDILALL